jgi:zinc protease
VSELEPEWAAFKLGTQILGGDFTARLNTVLRVKEGLTYGARFPVAFGGHDSGPMRVSTYVAPKDLAKAIDLSIGEIESMRKAPLGKEEIESFKNKLTNAFPFRFETVSDTLGQHVMLAFEDMPVQWLERYNAALRAVTAEEVHQAMQLIDPQQMVLVAVGNRDLLPVLGRYGRVKVLSAKALLDKGLSAATFVEVPPAPKATDEKGEPAEAQGSQGDNND